LFLHYKTGVPCAGFFIFVSTIFDWSSVRQSQQFLLKNILNTAELRFKIFFWVSSRNWERSSLLSLRSVAHFSYPLFCGGAWMTVGGSGV
jgi:hypothetical protein